ncbi:unnamed protein product, partial [Trichobilharzia regenti]
MADIRSLSAVERKLAKPGFGSMINLGSPQSEVRRRNTCDAAAGDKLSNSGLS